MALGNSSLDLSAGKKVIGSKWVFKVKRNADGSIERYKGRVVAKGYNQRPGFDYIEIFAPTVRMPTIRVVLAISALHDYHLARLIYPMPISMGRWTVMSTW
jgi:hypothetical protein